MGNPGEELLQYTFETVCKKRPELCKPRKVAMVAWDADDTMWRIEPYGIASGISPPFIKIDEDTLEAGEKPYYEAKPKPKPKKPKPLHPLRFIPTYKLEEEEERLREVAEAEAEEFDEWWKSPERLPPSEEDKQLEAIAKELVESLPEKQRKVIEKAEEVTGKQLALVPITKPKEEKRPEPAPKHRRTTIKLLPTFRETLARLKEKGIRNSIISLNSPGSVKRIVDAFDLTNEFIEIKDTWENKGKVFDDITKTHHINPCETIFVDNLVTHVEDVSKRGALSLVIGKNKDIEKPIEIMNYIEGNHA